MWGWGGVWELEFWVLGLRVQDLKGRAKARLLGERAEGDSADALAATVMMWLFDAPASRFSRLRGYRTLNGEGLQVEGCLELRELPRLAGSRANLRRTPSSVVRFRL